jgi:hypothetical protein
VFSTGCKSDHVRNLDRCPNGGQVGVAGGVLEEDRPATGWDRVGQLEVVRVVTLGPDPVGTAGDWVSSRGGIVRNRGGLGLKPRGTARNRGGLGLKRQGSVLNRGGLGLKPRGMRPESRGMVLESWVRGSEPRTWALKSHLVRLRRRDSRAPRSLPPWNTLGAIGFLGQLRKPTVPTSSDAAAASAQR